MLVSAIADSEATKTAMGLSILEEKKLFPPYNTNPSLKPFHRQGEGYIPILLWYTDINSIW